ncbi:MAG TPA: TonB-dependent receptor, partial [Vicinamibacterales bacterium]|nr:TonB-dependent receptor [Vicinamibacterales bacterium]
MGQPAAQPGSLTGVVRDANGGVLPGVMVTLVEATSQKALQASVTGSDGTFTLPWTRPGRYMLRLTLSGFEPHEQPLVVDQTPLDVIDVTLSLSRVQEQVSVRGTISDVGLTPSTRVNRSLLETLPSESVSSGLSSLLTLTSPGVAADSNGTFHPLGEHAETSFSIDNQPVSDQQSRIFSNQLSPNVIESIDVQTGVPPAEFGDKTSLVATVRTRSGLGVHGVSGAASFGYGSFRTPSVSFNIGRGNDRLGNFLALDGTVSGRFLDTPEPEPLHANGHVYNLFDRLDLHPSSHTTVQLNVVVAQSGFQTPNTYDQEAAGQDQQQRQRTINLAPSLTHVLTSHLLVEGNGWFRRDRVEYDGSADPLADQPAALAQRRGLTNAGAKGTVSYAARGHTIKAGAQQTTTWLAERFQTGLTSATFNTPCFTPAGDPSADTSLRSRSDCAAASLVPQANFLPALLPYDLTRGGSFFAFDGSARIRQWAGWLQDSVQLGHWTAMAGLRGDAYDGLSHASGIQPRLGLTYRLDRTNTIWRAGYGRIFLTPYNENLVLASSTGSGGFGGGVLGSVGGAPLTPARRNQFDAGVHQTTWRGIQVDADYFWKTTDGAYDFDVILNTPLTFPVQFRESKIEGGLVRVTLPESHGFQAYATFSHTSARLFGPELGGLRFSAAYAAVARPDHDEPFQQTTHLEYRSGRFREFWVGLTWRYDSGLVAVSVPTYADALALTGDEQAAMGLSCGGTFATVTQPIRSCTTSTLGATRIRIPALGTEN